MAVQGLVVTAVVATPSLLLVAARVAVANQPEFQKQLTDLLTQGEAAKRRQIQMQIERYKQQIERLENRLAQAPEQRHAVSKFPVLPGQVRLELADLLHERSVERSDSL